MMQMGFYFDQTRCIGCYTCGVACKDWHDTPAGPAHWRRITTIERGKYPQLFVAFLSLSCVHCANPACLAHCPADAISKREEDGVVVVDQEKCWGKDNCDLYCLKACPYQVPQFGAEENAKIQMCNFCLDRLAEGKKPICVDACPNRALDAGPLEELRAKHGGTKDAEGFDFSSEVNPSIIFKRRRSPL
ncbi:MAG: 4Fe-4S dicluster domain-containing protein [Chloroflexota bacterium]|nr:4Fe-4S dicluster domain-containing protein [Chloroflexota bacterium]